MDKAENQPIGDRYREDGLFLLFSEVIRRCVLDLVSPNVGEGWKMSAEYTLRWLGMDPDWAAQYAAGNLITVGTNGHVRWKENLKHL